MKQRVSCPVGYTAAAVGLASFSILETLTSKGPLVDLPIFSAAEWHAKVLQLGKSHSIMRSRFAVVSYTVCMWKEPL